MNGIPNVDSLFTKDEDTHSFAKQLFPEISDSLIERNYNEFSYAREHARKCKGCMSPDMCVKLANTATFKPVLSMQASGWVHTTFTQCQHSKVKGVGTG